MAKSSLLRVMISSRCDDRFPAGAAGQPLSEIRRELKREVEKASLLDHRMFEVWINEEAPPHAATWDSWEVCLQAVNDCDILIAIANGNAGWAETGGDVGICHAELMTGLSRASGKVRLIALPNVAVAKSPEGQRNK